LLIFTAGHGNYDDIEKTGYLVASDSLKDDASNDSYISQQKIFDILAGIKGKHVFLVIDACFSGALATKRSDPKRDITYTADKKLDALRRNKDKRTLIFLTSGAKEYVPDGKPGAHSPFAFQFIRALESDEAQNGIVTFRDFMEYADQVQGAPQPSTAGSPMPIQPATSGSSAGRNCGSLKLRFHPGL
jgi:uncharacterized caspase-like protein